MQYIPAPSWFLHCLGVGVFRPELSGEIERRGPGSRAIFAVADIKEALVVGPRGRVQEWKSRWAFLCPVSFVRRDFVVIFESDAKTHDASSALSLLPGMRITLYVPANRVQAQNFGWGS